MSVSIVPLKPEFISAAVELHLKSFPDFFLSYLGPRFLTEYYLAFLQPGAVAVMALNEVNTLVGLAVGTCEPQGFYGRLVKARWLRFAMAASTAALRRPFIIPRLFRALRYRGGAGGGNLGNRALLNQIAVSPDFQGAGIGGQLLIAWMDCAASKGVIGFYLTTDAKENDQVNKFYQKMSWRLEKTFLTREGREMNLYLKDAN